jgi:alpha-galactosidase
MASNGMKAVGWSYINLDDCWTGPNRTAAGNIMADPCVLHPHCISSVIWLRAAAGSSVLTVE